MNDPIAQQKTGELGERLAQQLMPGAVLEPTTGWDMIGINNERIEVKCSRYSKKYEGWSFKLSYMQIMNSTHVLLLALDLNGLLCSYWWIPTEEIPTDKIQIDEFNLADYSKWLVEVKDNGIS